MFRNYCFWVRGFSFGIRLTLMYRLGWRNWELEESVRVCVVSFLIEIL